LKNQEWHSIPVNCFDLPPLARLTARRTLSRRSRAGLKALPPQSGWLVNTPSTFCNCSFGKPSA